MCGNVDGHVPFAVLDAPLVVRDVERRQERGDDRKYDCDPDVPKSISHGGGFSFSFWLVGQLDLVDAEPLGPTPAVL
jgi:hypothetical protein